MVRGRPHDESKLKTNPINIRRRLRRNGQRYQSDLELYVHTVYKPMDEWDAEELARGRPRSKDGHFRGPSPKWITPAVQQEAKRRLLDMAFGQLAGHVDSAVKAIGNLITSDEVDEKGKPIVDARTRLAAAQFVIENVVGKPKAIVEIGGIDIQRSALAAAIILDDGSPQDDIWEGEIVDEGDEVVEMDDDDDE